MPLVAGLMRMPPHRFYVANVLSALVWAPAYLAPGMLLGEIGDNGGWRHLLFPAAAVGLIVVVWALVHLVQRRAARRRARLNPD